MTAALWPPSLKIVGAQTKFSSQMDREILDQLRAHARQAGRTLASVLNEAASDYLERSRVRPAFREAVDAVIDEHDELLTRLAR